MNHLGAVKTEQSCACNRERGASMIEYIVMIALIAIAVIGAVRLLGSNVISQQQPSQVATPAS